VALALGIGLAPARGAEGQGDRFAALRQLAREAGPVRLLEASLEEGEPAPAEAVRTARAQGLGAGLDILRAHHASLPRQARLSLRLRRWTPPEVLEQSRLVMENGFEYGGHPPFPLRLPVEWAADPFGDRNWQFALNSWWFLRPLVEASSLEGSEQHAAFAARIALDWAGQHVYDRKKNQFAWYDMAVGRRAAILAAVLDRELRCPALSDEELVRLLFAGRLHAEYLAAPERIAWHSNHGIHELAGLLALAHTIPELEGSAIHRQFAAEGILRLFSDQFTPEGIHREHSPFYHYGLVNLMKALLDTGWLEGHAEFETLFRKAAAATVWMVHPDGNLVRVGDSDVVPFEERLMGDHEQFLFSLTRGREGAPPAGTAAVFPESGYAAFRSPWSHEPYEEASFLFFAAAFHSRTHKHADDFTFEWSELGRVLVCDTGRYAYQYDHPARRYAESTRAHNTVEIDGRDYSRRADDAFGSALEAWCSSDGAHAVEAEVERRRCLGGPHRRILVFNPGRWLVVLDELRSEEEHEFTQWFHLAPDLSSARDGLAFRADLPGKGRELTVTPLGDAGGLEARLVRAQREPRLQGWTSMKPNTLVPNDALGFTRRGKEALFATLLRIGEPGRPLPDASSVAPLGDRGWAVRWAVGDRQEGFDYAVSDGRARLRTVNRRAGASP
jgi:hypothetical protein